MYEEMEKRKNDNTKMFHNLGSGLCGSYSVVGRQILARQVQGILGVNIARKEKCSREFLLGAITTGTARNTDL